MINPETGNRIRMLTVDSETGDEVQRRSLVKGYEFKKDNYLIVSDGRLVSRPGFVRLPGQGPILTSRPLGGTDRLHSLSGLALCLGDVELF